MFCYAYADKFMPRTAEPSAAVPDKPGVSANNPGSAPAELALRSLGVTSAAGRAADDGSATEDVAEPPSASFLYSDAGELFITAGDEVIRLAPADVMRLHYFVARVAV